jgi:hypothetical protein
MAHKTVDSWGTQDTKPNTNYESLLPSFRHGYVIVDILKLLYCECAHPSYLPSQNNEPKSMNELHTHAKLGTRNQWVVWQRNFKAKGEMDFEFEIQKA